MYEGIRVREPVSDAVDDALWLPVPVELLEGVPVDLGDAVPVWLPVELDDAVPVTLGEAVPVALDVRVFVTLDVGVAGRQGSATPPDANSAGTVN